MPTLTILLLNLPSYIFNLSFAIPQHHVLHVFLCLLIFISLFDCFCIYLWYNGSFCLYIDDDSFASERDVQPTDDQVTSFVFNQHHSSSIEAQRECLPIFKYRDQILYCLENYQTLVLVGETGCGKSTQVPQVCYIF